MIYSHIYILSQASYKTDKMAVISFSDKIKITVHYRKYLNISANLLFKGEKKDPVGLRQILTHWREVSSWRSHRPGRGLRYEHDHVHPTGY